MSRRLEQLSEQSLESGGRGAQKAVAEAGFDEDLKRRLEERIANASFRSDNASAFAQAEMPSSAGQGTREMASARAWTGSESVEDASLRMLNDAYKPLKAPVRLPSIRGPPARIDTGRSRKTPSSGSRIANARDKTSIYAFTKDPSLSETERENMRKELKERFAPAARAVPASIQGIANLANQRIEDAIARGQFKNLPRGKVLERDYNASSPFLDTTEYFMNKIIQRQDIVPPWIEKQQEVVSTASKFRSRLRAEWRRHVARTISSKGGSLESQTRLAEAYAAAEAIDNPPKAKVEKLNTMGEGGQLSQITLTGQPRADDATPTTDAQPAVTVTEQSIDDAGRLQAPEQTMTLRLEDPQPAASLSPQQPPRPIVAPFRDQHWLDIERSYQKLAIESLNSLTRSYNLMAPQLAKKPYYSLERELRSCYADVAPHIADEIRQRASAPKLKLQPSGHKPEGVLDRFGGGGHRATIYDDVKPQYGFKQLWRDLFRRE